MRSRAVRGPVEPRTGMVMHLGEPTVVGEVVIARFDHADLNRHVFCVRQHSDHRESGARGVGPARAQAGYGASYRLRSGRTHLYVEYFG
jgi:hypothetical protein